MKVIGEYAASVGCPTPLFSASEPIYRAALSTGYADQDTGSGVRRAGGDGGDQAMTATLRNPRRHAHRLGCADRDGRRPRAARGRVPPDRRTASIPSSSPTAPTRRASRSRTAIRARGSAWWRSIPTSRRARPTTTRAGKWSIRRNGCRDGYACVRVDSRGAGRSPGFIDHFSPRETQGFLRLHRMGRRAALVERQGRAQRHLVLRHQPVARRRRCSRRISPRCASGKARPTGIAT